MRRNLGSVVPIGQDKIHGGMLLVPELLVSSQSVVLVCRKPNNGHRIGVHGCSTWGCQRQDKEVLRDTLYVTYNIFHSIKF